MTKAQDRTLTVANILSIMTVGLAAVGFLKTEIGIPADLDAQLTWAKVAALVAIHACLTWRLTQALKRYLELRAIGERRKYKARAAFLLMTVYAGVDVWLVHSGLGWIFPWAEVALYAASIGFTAINLLGDWVEHRDEDDLPKADRAPQWVPTPPEQASEDTQRICAEIRQSVENMNRAEEAKRRKGSTPKLVKAEAA